MDFNIGMLGFSTLASVKIVSVCAAVVLCGYFIQKSGWVFELDGEDFFRPLPDNPEDVMLTVSYSYPLMYFF